jgi:hypothetical protein
MMTMLGGAAEAAAVAGIGSVSRSAWVKHLGAAITGASGAAVVLGGYEVLNSQPERAFTLLQSWGPSFLIAVIAYFLIVAIRESSGIMAQSMLSSAQAASRTADALTRLADLNGDQARETQRLATFAAQGTENMLERFDKQDVMLVDLAGDIKGLHTILSKEKTALDQKEKEAEQRCNERHGGQGYDHEL